MSKLPLDIKGILQDNTLPLEDVKTIEQIVSKIEETPKANPAPGFQENLKRKLMQKAAEMNVQKPKKSWFPSISIPSLSMPSWVPKVALTGIALAVSFGIYMQVQNSGNSINQSYYAQKDALEIQENQKNINENKQIASNLEAGTNETSKAAENKPQSDAAQATDDKSINNKKQTVVQQPVSPATLNKVKQNLNTQKQVQKAEPSAPKNAVNISASNTVALAKDVQSTSVQNNNKASIQGFTASKLRSASVSSIPSTSVNGLEKLSLSKEATIPSGYQLKSEDEIAREIKDKYAGNQVSISNVALEYQKSDNNGQEISLPALKITIESNEGKSELIVPVAKQQ